MVYNKNNKLILNKTYTSNGKSHGAAMFWGGVFAMKAALRESSLEAYQTIFKNMRQGLKNSEYKALSRELNSKPVKQSSPMIKVKATKEKTTTKK
jgi:hypothetical protein